MKHRARFIVSLLALMGLQGPLCSLVCAAESSATPVADHAYPSPHPCHEQPEPRRSEPTSTHDCTCSDAALTVPGKAEATTGTHSAALVIVASTTLHLLPAPSNFEPSRQYRERVPPPDILLRKSTLLI